MSNRILDPGVPVQTYDILNYVGADKSNSIMIERVYFRMFAKRNLDRRISSAR